MLYPVDILHDIFLNVRKRKILCLMFQTLRHGGRKLKSDWSKEGKTKYHIRYNEKKEGSYSIFSDALK